MAVALVVDHLFRPSLFDQYPAGAFNHGEWAAQVGPRIQCARNGVKVVLHITAGAGPGFMRTAQHRNIAKIGIPAGKGEELRVKEERLHAPCAKNQAKLMPARAGQRVNH